jgi:hypothetical protein
MAALLADSEQPKNSSTPPSGASASSSDTTTKETAQHLPPPRDFPALAEQVPPPLSNVRLHRFIYSLFFLIALAGAYYSYHIMQFKTDTIGGWRKSPGFTTVQQQQQQQQQQQYAGSASSPCQSDGGSVEDRINQLAQALGVPSDDLAGAIASAVREHVPPASLSSIAAKESGDAVRKLVGNDAPGGKGEWSKVSSGAAVASAASDGIGNFVDGIVNGMAVVIGMDELELVGMDEL